jgi:flagellar basal-body rod protein FlgG
MNSKVIAPIGALRQEKRFNIISNNLSNMQTIGFKKDIPLFRSFLSQSSKRVNSIFSDSTAISFLQGDLHKTGGEFDLAIDGEGFFKVSTPSGIRYTRAGNFILEKGRLLTRSDHYPVLGRKGPLRIEGRNIKVELDGTVIVDGIPIDQIHLVTFKDLRALKKVEHSLFKSEGEREIEIANPRILQGFLEYSNVNPIVEMVQLMDTFRTYESCMKVIQNQDEMDSKAVNELGRIR